MVDKFPLREHMERQVEALEKLKWKVELIC